MNISRLDGENACVEKSTRLAESHTVKNWWHIGVGNLCCLGHNCPSFVVLLQCILRTDATFRRQVHLGRCFQCPTRTLIFPGRHPKRAIWFVIFVASDEHAKRTRLLQSKLDHYPVPLLQCVLVQIKTPSRLVSPTSQRLSASKS